MRKKLVVIILLLLIIFGSFWMIYSPNHFKVGNAFFSIPDGFKTIENNDFVNLTNGNEYICFIKNNENEDINKSIKNFVEIKQKDNISVKITNFTINDVNVFKSSENKGSQISYYWFIKNGMMYKIFTLSGNSNTDDLVRDEIKTMDVSFF